MEARRTAAPDTNAARFLRCMPARIAGDSCRYRKLIGSFHEEE